ncbi:hypothetical protein [Agriterribacter sp.]|uniref:hypothetical protein n=1 Tax=Agriterribacter sp. TaxID=2821509 RepID=UPI002CB6F2D1|nr:hypothetical protein [Agriterribacter sp.]HRO47431.1 hypothetical protein [Agriterribacter sp.]HRQ15912.1 hypothetical protein [Agriterribacter sp.]
MKKTEQQINLSRHLPIDIRVWSGSFELYTHPELSVKIDAGAISNMDIVPGLLYTNDRITIAHQSFSSILVNSNAIKIKIYVPDESIVRFRQLTGSLSVSGSYKNLITKNWLGDVHSHLDDLFVREEASLEVISGDVYIDSEDQSGIQSRSGYEHYQLFKFYDGSSIKAHTHIGEVKWNPYPGKKVHYFA